MGFMGQGGGPPQAGAMGFMGMGGGPPPQAGAMGFMGQGGGPPQGGAMGFMGQGGGPPQGGAMGAKGQGGGPPQGGAMGFMGQGGGPPQAGAMGFMGQGGGPPPQAGAMGAMGMGGGPPPQAGAAGFMGMGGGPPPQAGAAGFMGQMGGPPPNFGAMGAMGGWPGFGQQGGRPAVSESFLSVKPAFKRVLDQLDPKKVIYAEVTDDEGAKQLLKRYVEWGGDTLKNLEKLDAPNALGICIRSFSEDRLTIGIIAEMTKNNDAVSAEQTVRNDTKPRLDQLAKAPFKLPVTLTGGFGNSFFGAMGGPPNFGAMGFVGAMGGPPPNFGAMGFMGAMGGPPPNFGAMGFMGAMGGPPPNFGAMGAMGGPPPQAGAAGAMGGPPPQAGAMGFMGQGGGPPPQAGAMGFMGQMGGPPPQAGAMGFMGQMGGPPPQAGAMGFFGQMGGPPPNLGAMGFMGQMGGPGFFGQMGGQNDATVSTLDLRVSGKTVTATLDLKLSEHRSAVPLIKALAAQGVVQIRNRALLAVHQSYRHDLAAALLDYSKAKGAFPRGTANRPADRNKPLPWKPAERVAWTAELIPYLGPGIAGMPIDPTKSWNDEENLPAASTAIPQLLAPDDPPGSYPADSLVIQLPGVKNPVGGINFVGISGVGPDTAKYMPGNAETDKLLGVFGYDRVTKISDIKDGLDKTIALIQVPPTFKGCWLAGGGATIRGVDEIDPLDQFVCTEYKGKKGTFAIMCDGKVRFIAADMNPDTFKALCTISGGEPIDNIEAIAPEVKGAVLKPVVELPKPPVDPVKPPDDGSKQDKGDWVEFVDPDGSYRVWMPATPKVKTIKVSNVSRFVDSDSKEGIFRVHTEVFPKAITADEQEQLLATAARVEELQHSGAQIKKKDITFEGVSGIEIEIPEQRGGIYRRRSFVVKDQYFELICRGQNEGPIKESDAQKFFNSFRITGGKSPADPPKPTDGAWEDFVIKGAPFSAKLPREQQIKSGSDTEGYVVVFRGGAAFSLRWKKEPAPITGAAIDEAYQETKKFIEFIDRDAKVTAQKSRQDGFTGVEYQYESSKAGRGTCKVFVVKDWVLSARAYPAMLKGKYEIKEVPAAEAETFFKSFKITPR
jgi:hypothetical protein